MAVSTSSNVVHLWKRSNNGLHFVEYALTVVEAFIRCSTLTLPCLSECVSIFCVAELQLVAVGGVDSNVHLYCSYDSGVSFKHVIALKGHQDWIKALDFTTDNDCVSTTISFSNTCKPSYLLVLPKIREFDFGRSTLV